jgi:hypothetical protein
MKSAADVRHMRTCAFFAEGAVTIDAEGNKHTRDGFLSYRVVSDDPRVADDVTGTWNTNRWAC